MGSEGGERFRMYLPLAFSSSLLARVSRDYCVIEGHTLRGTPCLVLTHPFTFFFPLNTTPGRRDLPRLD